MQAIILGAGRGIRLGAANPGLPKPLLQIGGEVLLHRQLRLLNQVFPDLDATTVLVGYRADVVRSVGGNGLRYSFNPEFESTNTAFSLKLALETDPQDAILLNGDVFFDSSAIECVRSLCDGAACEFKANVEREEIQVIVDGAQIREIGKDIGGAAEAVGIYRMSSSFIRSYLNEYRVEDSTAYYEDVFNRILAVGDVGFRAARLQSGCAIEIDTPADLAAAEGLARQIGTEWRSHFLARQGHPIAY